METGASAPVFFRRPPVKGGAERREAGGFGQVGGMIA
jgi:hypothetical protein